MYWFNTRTGEVKFSKDAPWMATDVMGPYATEELAKNAYLVAATRNVEADLAEQAWEEETGDEWDKEDREWEESW